MQLIVSSFFSEVGIDFKISHKVNLYIRNKFIENVMKTYGLDKDDPNRSLNLNVTTTAKTTVVDVKGPVYDKRNDFVSYGLWLPYKNIVNAKYPLQAYLKYYFDACVEVFKKYNVSENIIRSIQSIVEKEVLNNTNYEYKEEYLPPPDLSDLGL